MQQEDDDKTNAHMLYIGCSKTSFRCDNQVSINHKCGCNVFKKIGELRYKCNGCGAVYSGEPES
jgi:hypothetical protein